MYLRYKLLCVCVFFVHIYSGVCHLSAYYSTRIGVSCYTLRCRALNISVHVLYSSRGHTSREGVDTGGAFFEKEISPYASLEERV